MPLRSKIKCIMPRSFECVILNGSLINGKALKATEAYTILQIQSRVVYNRICLWGGENL